jgi:hypothetical protein
MSKELELEIEEVETVSENDVEINSEPEPELEPKPEPEPELKKRGRGRPKKVEKVDVVETETIENTTETVTSSEPIDVSDLPQPKKRGRKPKASLQQEQPETEKKYVSEEIAEKYASVFVIFLDGIQQAGFSYFLKIPKQHQELLAFDKSSKEALIEAYKLYLMEEFPELTPGVMALITTGMVLASSFMTARIIASMHKE